MPVLAFDRSVTLNTTNTVQARILGFPGSVIQLAIYGTIPPPTITKLEPVALPITQGGTGTVTATISAAQPEATPITLLSSDPSVASVPSTVTVPVGAVTVAVPVAGVAPGTATITASLNGSSVSSTVTVAPAGPTLTSLLPSTLQVTQGASGILTATLSAAQATDTLVSLTTSNSSVVSLPPSGTVTVPAGQTSQAFPIFGVGQGTATITASLNGTTAESQVSVVIPAPVIVSLLPPTLALTEGSSGTLTLTLNASQPTNTAVALNADPSSVVGLPSSVTVPAGAVAVPVPVVGLTRGTATVTAALPGSTATAALTVVPPPPTLQALTCPAALTPAATPLCTVTLNATQVTETSVALGATPSDVLSLPSTVTIPANTLTASLALTGLTVGSATITAGPLNGTTQSASVQVLPPPPTLVRLTLPTAGLVMGATGSLTLTLNAAQPADTAVPLSATPSSVLGLPASITVPAGAVAVPVPVVGLTPGTATVTAGPLNGTSVESTLTVNQFPPTVSGLTPVSLSLAKGRTGVLTVTLAPTQSDLTVVPLSSSNPSVEVPASVTVPAGSATAAFPVIARSEGSGTLTAGPLNGTSQMATITVTPAELVTLTITPPAPAIAKGETQQFAATGIYTDGTAQDLTGTAAWSSSDETIAPITSPGGLATGLTEGVVTITATIGTTSATASLTVTPPILASLAIAPLSPTRNVGETLPFQATGTLTDGTTQDLTAIVAWTSSDPAVASIDATGLAAALAPGSTTITATHPDGFTAETLLSVILPPPTIGKFEPSAGKVGTTVTITGANFFTVSGVSFNGTAAPSFTVNDLTSITVAVPADATTGPISVTTSAGTATSTGTFIVLPTFDFTLTVEPATVTAIAGTSVGLTVHTVTTGGFTGLTTLSTGPLPEGVTASASTPALGPNASALVTLTSSGSTPSPATIEIRGTATIEGTTVTRTATATLAVQTPSGQTTLVGRILNEDIQPIPGVTVRIGSLSTVTDAAGNFVLADPPVGTQLVVLDGSTATVPEKAYPTIVLTMTIQAGVANSLPYQPYFHAQKAQNFVNISNSSAQRVVTDPEIPGFQMTIPAGVSIIGWDGQPNQVVSVRTVPIDRLPIPPPPAGVNAKTVYMFYFNKPGGGVPSSPIPVTVPNELEFLPGDLANLWYFDEAPDGSRPNAWAIAGTMTVSSDGRTLTTAPGVGIPRFCCGAMFVANQRASDDQQRTDRQKAPASKDCSPECNDPVQLGTGLFIHRTTDLVLPGRIPLVFSRTYRTNDPSRGPFGRGTTWPFDIDLLLDYTGSVFTLITPGNARAMLTRQADGSFANTTEPWLRGARLTPASPGYLLRFKDGTTWTFDASRFLTAIADRHGNRISLERIWGYRLARILADGDRVIELIKDEVQDWITELRDPLGRTVRYTYNAAGYLETVTDPAGGVTRYTYDANGRMLTVTDPRGTVVITNEYDSAGRVSRQTYADGGVWTYAYTTAGGLITEARMTDPSGNASTFRFNPGSYPTQHTDAIGQTSTSQRAIGTNEVRSSTDALGRTTRYSYDANGNVTSVTDVLNNTTTSTYDPIFNQVTSTTDALGNVTTFEYDSQGNLIAITDPEQNTKPEPERLKSRMTYNQFGQVLTTTDPLGNTSTFEDDEVGNLVATIDPVGNRTERTYDAGSRLIAVKDPKGAMTRFAYDPLDRLISTTDPLGGVTRFTYDPNGNLLTVTDARGNTTTHEYNARNRLSKRTDPLGRFETFTYDFNGNLKTITDRKGQTTTYTYDAQNRLVRTEFADGSSITNTYDPAGNLLTATDSLTGTITRTYDSLDHLVGEVTPQGAVTYSYDPADRRNKMQVNGLAPVTYGYDANSRLTQITQGSQMVGLGYDAANRRTALTMPNGIAVEYQYNSGSRLVAQIYRGASGVLGDLQYAYDANGSRLAASGSWARSGIPAMVTSSAYDAANQQLAFGEVSQTFDANGNLLTQTEGAETTTYTWDARNRLVAINGPSVTATFSYDVFGRRIAKSINGDMTTFHYDALDAVREINAAGEASYLRMLNIDEPLTRIDANAAVVYMADSLGSTVALVGSDGVAITEYTYEPFGVTQVSGQPTANPLEFIGRENDKTGLYYYRARYYGSRVARFTQVDRLGIGGGSTNLYAYAENNPTTYIDPLGLSKCVRKECSEGSHHELGRRPKSEWWLNTSIAIGPALGQFLPVYAIKCFWKRKAEVTYGYVETCTAICKDDCGRVYIHHESGWKTYETEVIESTQTSETLSARSGWGGSPDLTELYCKRYLRP